jgi:hypothetical protein
VLPEVFEVPSYEANYCIHITDRCPIFNINREIATFYLRVPHASIDGAARAISYVAQHYPDKLYSDYCVYLHYIKDNKVMD